MIPSDEIPPEMAALASLAIHFIPDDQLLAATQAGHADDMETFRRIVGASLLQAQNLANKLTLARIRAFLLARGFRPDKEESKPDIIAFSRPVMMKTERGEGGRVIRGRAAGKFAVYLMRDDGDPGALRAKLDMLEGLAPFLGISIKTLCKRITQEKHKGAR